MIDSSGFVASPVFSAPPTPVMTGFGFRSSEATNLNKIKLVDVTTIAILVFILVTCNDIIIFS